MCASYVVVVVVFYDLTWWIKKKEHKLEWLNSKIFKQGIGIAIKSQETRSDFWGSNINHKYLICLHWRGNDSFDLVWFDSIKAERYVYTDRAVTNHSISITLSYVAYVTSSTRLVNWQKTTCIFYWVKQPAFMEKVAFRVTDRYHSIGLLCL